MRAMDSAHQPAWAQVVLRSALALALGFAPPGCRAAAAGSVAPPGQPATGPGGADYLHQKATAQRFGQGADEYWLFTPDDPRPREAPLVIFLHGWGGTDPRSYGAWLEHITRKGHIVVFPRYQTDLRTPVHATAVNATRAIRSAVDRLAREGPVRPRADRWAWVGHSLGGMLAANLAAGSVGEGFPPPGMLMSIEPGAPSLAFLDPLASMPADALALVLVGDEDRIVTDEMALLIYAQLAHLRPDNVDFITVRSDYHSNPPLLANHFAPLAAAASFPPDAAYGGNTPGEGGLGGLAGGLGVRWRQQALRPNALDFYGYWKLLDGLLDAAFRGEHREFALGGTVQQRFMGQFADGVEVRPLIVQD